MEALRHTVEGIAVLKDWLGSGAIPVAQEQAERRAGICISCPMNVEPKWWERVTTNPIARTMKRHIEVKNDMALKVSQEIALHVCRSCGCCLPLKVWVPIEHIRDHMEDGVKEKLTPFCWILKELQS